MSDSRLNIANLSSSNRLKTLVYDSDYNAIRIRISRANPFVLEKTPEAHKYNFNRIDLLKFKTAVMNLTSQVPSAVQSVSNKEVDGALNDLDEKIVRAIDIAVPKIKKFNSSEAYSNASISRLQKHKSFLITNINRLHRAGTTNNLVRLNILKGLLTDTKKETSSRVF